MKKFYVLPFLAMACMIMSGCTSDYEFEDGQSAKEQKALEVKAKIQELADDYGLEVHFTQMADADYFCNANLDSVDEEFRSLAALRGTYKMLSNKNEANETIVSQKGKHLLKRKLSEQKEEFEFETQTVGDYTCYCKLSYRDSPEEGIHDIKTNAYISPSGGLGSSSDGTVATLDGNIIKITGSVSFYFDSGKVASLLIDGEYSCVENDGWIIWY